MTVFCVGVDHVSAPLALRARLSWAPEAMDVAFESAMRDVRGLDELAVLSTCNRVELYASTEGDEYDPEQAAIALARFLARQRDVAFEALEPSLRVYVGVDAERHLCRVAAGLESLVVGESEILAQVIDAYERGRRGNIVGATLSATFDTAIRAGKRARAETALGRNPSSVSSVAMKVAEELAPRLEGNRALFIGAGKMGRIAVERLSGSGRWQVTVTSRTGQNAEELASRSGVSVAPYERLAASIADADVVFTATSARVPIIDMPLVRAAMVTRQDRPIVFIDVAVPPNVDAAVRTISGVRLFDVDELRPRVDAALEQQRREVPRVEAIIEEELGRLRAEAANGHAEEYAAFARRLFLPAADT